MLGISPRGGKARFVVLLIPLLLTVTFLTSRARRYDTTSRVSVPIPFPAPGQHFPKINDPDDWWIDFFTSLEDTRVTAGATKIKGKAPATNWKPNVGSKRPDLQQLSDDDEAKFRESHAAFVDQLPWLASRLPYNANSTGIVTTAGVPNFGQAISVVLMARQAGSSLPIQIALDSSNAFVDAICADTLPRYNATCLYLEHAWAKAAEQSLVPKFARFQWKFLSLVASTFQNVLFLDADCLPIHNPDPIFGPGAEPFTSTGFITWPDFWTPTASPKFYQIAGDIEVPPLKARTSSESGVMVYDKARHADTLLLAAYYNYNGPRHYYAMLTQHGPGEGDKETFFQAALVLDGLRRRGVYKPPTAWTKTAGPGVKKGYWDVKMLPKVHGRTSRGEWRGMFMQQMDPVEDYRAVMAAFNKAQTAHKPTNQTIHRRRPDQPRRPLSPTHRHRSGNPPPSSKDDDDDDITPFLHDPTPLSTASTLPVKHNHGRFMFFHHNGAKPDFSRILDQKSGLIATNEQDKFQRLWGNPDWIVKRTGRDVEKLLWRASMGVYCQPELGGFEGVGEVCGRLREVWEGLFA